MSEKKEVMRTYSLDQFAKFEFAQINDIQRSIDEDALAYIDSLIDALSQVLPPKSIKRLKEYYTNTMEKYRLIHKAIVSNFDTEENPGYPKDIFNINLKDGSIETKKGRNPPYFVRHLAPCNSAMLHYKHSNNDIYVIIPPIKGIDRTIEKSILECTGEYSDFCKKFFSSLRYDPNAKAEFSRAPLAYKDPLEELDSYRLPKDIYRLSVTSRYRSDIEKLIKQMEKRFPDYIKFEDGERNQYKTDIDENPRWYFDIKKTAKITIPGTNKSFYIEFQFKQTHMFFAHIRSHSAYEDFRVLDAKYKELEKKERTPENKAKLFSLKKQCNEKKQLCIDIHKSAVHQSNLYLFRRLFWLNENANALHDHKEREAFAENFLRENYIVESKEPFDGATAFTTDKNEYLNKSYYLKWLGVLPENFNEFGKNAKSKILKEWEGLSDTELAQFDNITKMAIKYQPLIRSIQQKEKSEHLDTSAILTMHQQNSL